MMNPVMPISNAVQEAPMKAAEGWPVLFCSIKFDYETNLSSGVNDIFNAIMKVAEPQQQYDDLERKRQRDKVKAKPSKLRYKEMEENEL